MGEAKNRQLSQRALLEAHPFCVYCGGLATTIDHCPPRCFFLNRVWPETFAYPACSTCNAVARLDEQALAVMVRVKATQPNDTAEAIEEFGRLLTGVRNNQADLFWEWRKEGATSRKRSFRNIFGRQQGDFLRYSGWGLMHMGPLTAALIQRFMVRLGQSMFYNHVGKLFQGTMYTRHASLLQIADAQAYMSTALSIAPIAGIIRRSGKTLAEQFSYRFNTSAEHETFYAVVYFSEQFVFQITALGPSMAARFANQDWPAEAIGQRTEIRFSQNTL